MIEVFDFVVVVVVVVVAVTVDVVIVEAIFISGIVFKCVVVDDILDVVQHVQRTILTWKYIHFQSLIQIKKINLIR